MVKDGRWEGDDDDDRPLASGRKRTAEEVNPEVNCDAFWGQGPRKQLREAIRGCADYFVAITNNDAGAEPLSMLIMSLNDVPRFKIDNPTQRERALRRARIVEKLVMRTIHGWIFKLSSRSNGFTRVESYIIVDYTIDVARAVWQGLEWSRVVSQALIYYTLQMKGDVPLWFAMVKIVDKP
ncbi:hypothetical protein CBR_g56912 [Chara braunii]|uniref:Helitron helicase-like domain-containing protein n=1 Tax=Chara braunii TaxID=69332 RepID=A0A388MDW7_CHABU|nr:hypothetical protein CBR_g56912 [Chara braunii]|eukprot:GBG92751.1 hypothetical protein CBR_g56912 [Chara braunii]